MTPALSQSIDIFRGILCQWVIIAHLVPTIFSYSGIQGRFAVWCFFGVSGFLNYFSYRNSSSIKEYYYKRIVRLYPLLLISYLIISLFERNFFIKDLYTLCPFILNIKSAPPHNGVLWTLIIELQLYVLTPFLYYLMPHFRKITPSFLKVIFIIILIFISIGINSYYYGKFQLEDRTLFSAIPLYFYGMTVARDISIHLSHRNLFSFYSGLFLLIFCNVIANFKQIWLHTLVEGRLVPFLLLVPLLQYSSLKIPKIFSQVPLFLGKMTFEIYLFHGLGIYFYRYFHFSGWKYVFLFYWIFPMTSAILYTFLYKQIRQLISFIRRLDIQETHLP